MAVLSSTVQISHIFYKRLQSIFKHENNIPVLMYERNKNKHANILQAVEVYKLPYYLPEKDRETITCSCMWVKSELDSHAVITALLPSVLLSFRVSK